MNRRTARTHAFCLIFQLPFHEKDELEEVIGFYLEDLEKDEPVDKGGRDFIVREVLGVAENLADIDGYIQKYAQGWEFNRIFKADLAVMRLAAYELLFCNDIPASVTANEAVLLAKEYGDDSSSSFVNGILGKIAREAGTNE